MIMKSKKRVHIYSMMEKRKLISPIREHQRKYQYIIADATGWRKEN